MADKPENRKIKVIQRNRKAYHDFDILQKFEAGIVLTGPEVKSIRNGKCSIQDAYCFFPRSFDKNNKHPKKLELYIRNFHISPYEQANDEKYNPRRERKLLLHKRELLKLQSAIEQKGLTLIPLSVYLSGPFVKLEIALVKGKRKYDKREEIKKKDIQKEMSKKLKL